MNHFIELLTHKQILEHAQNFNTKLSAEEKIIMYSTTFFFLQNYGKCKASGLFNGCLP